MRQSVDDDPIGFAIRRLREDFHAQPPHVQRETLRRVRLLLEGERRRGQSQTSYLRRVAQAVYGVPE